MSAPAKTLNVPASDAWVPVSLPHALARTIVPTRNGISEYRAEVTTAWYRISVPADEFRAGVGALYLPRWHTEGNLSIYVGNELVFSSLAEGDHGAFNAPLLIRLPVSTSAQGLKLTFRMDFPKATGAALSSVWIGPIADLRPMFEQRRLLQNRIPQITSSIFLALGLFALAFWIRRRHETMQLLFFVLSALFYVRELHYYIETTWIPVAWFSWLTLNTLGWLNVVVYFFAVQMHGRRYRWFELSLLAFMALASIVSAPLAAVYTQLSLFSPLAYLVFIVASLCVTIITSYASWVARSRECAVLAAILWLNLGLGVHDWLLTGQRIDIESIYLLPIGVLALLAMFLVSMLRRLLGAIAASESAGAVLKMRLEERERELAESYGKLREVEQARLLSNERQRLMREMHDGLGSELMISLMAVERGEMQVTEVAQMLRGCVDHLKLTIDSLEPVGDDLLILLATLRYRVEGRLEAAGIKLIWNADNLPSLPWLNPTLSLHILRMLQEILTNALKHAAAKTITVSIRNLDRFVEIEIVDDGVGFDVAAAGQGRGLANLRQRAAILRAQLFIASKPQATCVRILLPVS